MPRRHHLAGGAGPHPALFDAAGILTGVIIGMARAIGETAPIITIGALTFIAFLPPAPLTGRPPAGFCSSG
jgi:phosphate transport system permease protein